MMEPWNEQVDDEEEAGEEAEADVGEPPAHPRLEDGGEGEGEVCQGAREGEESFVCIKVD